MSLSGGHEFAPVSQNAGHVPRVDGAWNSPRTSQFGNWSLTSTCCRACTAPEWYRIGRCGSAELLPSSQLIRVALMTSVDPSRNTWLWSDALAYIRAVPLWSEPHG